MTVSNTSMYKQQQKWVTPGVKEMYLTRVFDNLAVRYALIFMQVVLHYLHYFYSFRKYFKIFIYGSD